MFLPMADQDHGDPAVPLNRTERRQVAARAVMSAPVVHEVIRREGEEELSRPGAALFWSALAAGLSMGFSLVAEAVLRTALPDAPWRPIVVKLGYPLGFLFVILGRQQLFTENTLTVVLPFLAAPSLRNVARVARVWSIVLVANAAGALAFAWSIGRDRLFSPEMREAFTAIGMRAVSPEIGTLVVRGIYGGWLIALMVWLLPAARGARFFVIVTVTWLVGAAELAHSVAGSVEVLYVVASGAVPFTTFLFHFFLPVVAGNTVGGVALVAALGHAQVVAGNEEREEEEAKPSPRRARGSPARSGA
jgi:formate/nitrite transporter FocA (FNT family)